MRAAVLHAHGQVPEVGELSDPEPGEDGELLEVLAAGMNPIDIRIATGTLPAEKHDPPYVAGKEGVGRRADGSLVWFERSCDPYGAFAARTLIPPGSGFPVPGGVDPALAVCLGVSGLAAWLGLEWRGRLAPGETVLVLGASGVVGQIAVQVAKLLGAGRVVAAGRDAGALERAQEPGADATVVLGDDLADASDGGYDVVLDPLWGAPAEAAIALIAPFGRHVNIGQSAGAEATLSSAAIRATPIDLLGYTNFTAGEERKAAAYARLAQHAAAGEIRVEVERVPLEQAPDAWRRQGSSPHRKLVIVP